MRGIICISGKAESGKDTTGKICETYLRALGYRTLLIHFGDLTKYMCKQLFSWNGEKDESGRSLLQWVGTERVRKYNPDYWALFVANILNMFGDQWDYVIITDTRFPNEIEVLRYVCDQRIFHIRVNRCNHISKLTESQKIHESETALDNYAFDYIIENSGDLTELTNKAVAICKEIKDTLDAECVSLN